MWNRPLGPSCAPRLSPITFVNDNSRQPIRSPSLSLIYPCAYHLHLFAQSQTLHIRIIASVVTTYEVLPRPNKGTIHQHHEHQRLDGGQRRPTRCASTCCFDKPSGGDREPRCACRDRRWDDRYADSLRAWRLQCRQYDEFHH